MEPHVVYNHSIECLRFALNTIGYDNCIKELHFIKHLHQIPPPPLKQEQPVQVPVKNTEIAPEIEVAREPEHKNIVIEPPSKYSRTIPPDGIRCTRILNNGNRCTLKKVQDTEVCNRHSK